METEGRVDGLCCLDKCFAGNEARDDAFAVLGDRVHVHASSMKGSEEPSSYTGRP